MAKRQEQAQATSSSRVAARPSDDVTSEESSDDVTEGGDEVYLSDGVVDYG